jgi:phasin family protein
MAKDTESALQTVREQTVKMMENFKIPGVDIQALVDDQRKNIDAMTKAVRIASEGAAAVSQRQLEIFQTTSEQLSAMFRDLKMTREQQTELAKKAFQTALENARELAEMSAKASNDAFAVMKQRMAESLEEMRKAAQAKTSR